MIFEGIRAFDNMALGFPSAALSRSSRTKPDFLHQDVATRLLQISLIFSLNTRFITLPVQQDNVC